LTLSLHHTDKRDSGHSVSLSSEGDGSITLRVSGRLSLETIEGISARINKVYEEEHPTRLMVDLAEVKYMDSAGALLLLVMEDEATKKGVAFSTANMTDKAKDILGLIHREALTAVPINPRERYMGFLEEIGEGSIGILDDVGRAITFGGILIAEVISSLLHPASVRWADTLNYMKKVGVDGLPILGLISFLLGLIMAFMSSLQLKQFGANIYVASLVGLAMVRELGPIITAILVAGRSGSAFAAEIGTMKVNEEVDALITMGFDPVKFLAIPKVFAAMFVFPLLTLFADLFAIFGGMLVGVIGLDITIYTYLKQTATSFGTFDILSGTVKSVVFAILISGIGCQRGFEVRGGAEAVGNATTSAVVASLFLIIVTDSIFAIILNYIR
jgi:phospholipid/cholesterol/gamma-HCH transport system permease protein